MGPAAVEAMRAELPAVTGQVYLNTGTFGPLPEPARQTMREHLDWAVEVGRIGTAGLDRWHELEAAARAALAVALRCPEQDLALTHATTDGINTVLAGLAWQPGDEVLVGDVEHPGLLEPLAHLADTSGVRVRTIATTEGRALASIEAALGERTRLIAVSHVLWSTGEVLDLPGILELARGRDIPVLADGAQSAGAVPVDLTELACDFYAVPGQKWLCGPSGTGALYVRPDRVEQLAPPWPGYVTRDRRPDSPGTELWPGARRYDVGAVTLAALAGLAASLHWRARHDLAAGWLRSAQLAARLRRDLAELPGVRVADPGSPTPFATLTLPAGLDAEQVVAALEAAGVLVRWIPQATPMIRASVGPWNTEADLGRFVEVLAVALSRR